MNYEELLYKFTQMPTNKFINLITDINITDSNNLEEIEKLKNFDHVEPG